ncbi:MAG: DUF3078 domain-containing protein [Ignavibacteria bacterium]|nr:DUF3078 domain-containing protein [Ignavibacteria bacterium]
MKKLFGLIAFILLFQCLQAQPMTDTTFKIGWTPKGVVSINLSQIAFDNWIQGGENSLSFLSLLNAGAYYKTKVWFLANRLKVSYGGSNTSLQYKTTDNELRIENILIRDLNWQVNPYFSNEVRTGIVNGYEYGADSRNQITAFFDPGYITQSLGFIFARKGFNTRLGIGLQETFTNKFNKFSDDVETSDVEKFKIETGIESVSEANYEFMENMLYTGRLRLFSRFNSMDVWDVNWENIVTAKVNDYISVNFTYNLIYQQDQTYRTQTKEALQVGFSYVIF